MLRSVEDIVVVGPGTGTRHVPDYPEGLVSEGWREEEWRNFGDEAEGRYYGGVWYGEPGTAKLDSMPFDELCYLRKGSVRFTDSAGASKDFSEGQAFFVPRNFSGHWAVIEAVEMVYVALGPFEG